MLIVFIFFINFLHDQGYNNKYIVDFGGLLFRGI